MGLGPTDYSKLEWGAKLQPLIVAVHIGVSNDRGAPLGVPMISSTIGCRISGVPIGEMPI